MLQQALSSSSGSGGSSGGTTSRSEAAAHPAGEFDNLVTHPFEFAGRRLSISNFALDELLNGYIAYHHVWEPWQLHLMSRVLKADSTCVDVGANIGTNGLFGALLCPRGRVFAYEPCEPIYQLLLRNIEQNHLTNVIAIRKGLSDRAGSLRMGADAHHAGEAHVIAGTEANENETIINADFAALDDEVRQRGISRIDFIKIDVEGHEMKTLTGGESALRQPDVQLAIEFSPLQQTKAAPQLGPFADRRLFLRLKSLFRHVFYMTREFTLVEMKDWHALRRRLLGGYFVDDLYCAHSIRPEVADMVVPPEATSAVAPNVLVTQEQVGGLSITYYNRDPDGWSLADDIYPPIVSARVEGPAQPLVLRFTRIYRRHLPEPQAGYASWPVHVLVGNCEYIVDLMEQEPELRLHTTGEPLDITLQAVHRVHASAYLGNPSDPRQIGFRVTLE